MHAVSANDVIESTPFAQLYFCEVLGPEKDVTIVHEGNVMAAALMEAESAAPLQPGEAK